LLTITFAVLAALALLGATSCRKDEGGGGGTAGGGANAGGAGGGKKIVVGFSQMENNGPWRIAETKSMRDEAAKRADRIEYIDTDAQGQTAKQVNDVEDLITRGVSAIFLAPREARGFESALQAAKEAKIPVFLIDREVEGKAGEDFVAFIGSDFVTEGRRAGEWLVKQTNGKAGIIELTGTSGASVAKDRHDGFMQALNGSPDMKILASVNAEFTRATAQNVMANLIQAHNKNITAVYTHNDEMALGAIQALEAAGMKPGKDIIIISVDGQKSALQAIIDGKMNATVECNPRFGPIAFDTLEKFLRGEKIEQKIIMQDRFFDASNAAQFVGEAY
jgi:ribose transport system substrate-binding protein